MRKVANFTPESYSLSKSVNGKVVEIVGQKLPPPNKRITFNQTDIKILDTKIVYKHKKGDIEYEVNRVNTIKSFGETRLHTNNLLYPGPYVVTIVYRGKLDESSLGEKSD